MIADWINIHTHRPGAGINIVDPCLGKVEQATEGVVYFSAGIHPMFIGEGTGKKLEEIERLAADGKIVAVGEAGLDRNSPAPMQEQLLWFERQAGIATRYDLPLIIHSVRAFPELIGIYNQCRSCRKWILHGYNNRREILQELLRHGFYISAGRHVMNEESHIYRLLPEIPADRLFIETDNSDYTIGEVYRKVAERRGVSVEGLRQIIRTNFEEVFPFRL